MWLNGIYATSTLALTPLGEVQKKINTERSKLLAFPDYPSGYEKEYGYWNGYNWIATYSTGADYKKKYKKLKKKYKRIKKLCKIYEDYICQK